MPDAKRLPAERRASLRWQLEPMEDQVIADFRAFQLGKGLAVTTVKNRESILRTASLKLNVGLLEITLFDLRRYLGREGVSQGTRCTERNSFRAFYEFCKDEGYREDNPAMRLAPIKSPRGEPRPFTAEQIDRMLAAGSYKRTRAMILLGYYQGFRVSSIARVHGRDIDLLSHTITTVGKGNKERTLPLHPVIAELAQTMPQDDWWFPARHGRDGPISGASVTNLLTRVKKRAGITDPRLTPHSLRHGFGTDLVEHGVDIRVVQELMMHESLATTQIYTGVSERRKREGITTLEPRQIPAHSGRTANAA